MTGVVLYQGVCVAWVEMCCRVAYVAKGYRNGKPIAKSMFFPSKLLTIDYSVHFQKQDVFLWWCMQAFSTRHMCVNTHIPYVHIGSQIYTQVHTQAPDLVFLLSRRNMNKTGVQRLSEKQRDMGCTGRSLCSSGSVFVPQSPCLDLQD